MPARASLAWLVGLAVAPLCHAQDAGSVGAAPDTVPAAILDAPTQAGAGPAASGSTLTQTTLLGIDREWLPAAHDIPIPDHVRDPDNLMRFYIDNRAQWRASDSEYLFSSIKASALEGYGYGNVSLESRSARLDLRSCTPGPGWSPARSSTSAGSTSTTAWASATTRPIFSGSTPRSIPSRTTTRVGPTTAWAASWFAGRRYSRAAPSARSTRPNWPNAGRSGSSRPALGCSWIAPISRIAS